uniref:VirB4-like type IV secretory system protein n=2 Tax=Sulfobacillus thermotolerans TaxID=338644 RepID=G5CJ15_9FIRM|nr:VirB4-like type IV secretory system protein [Sulfobacillus thermotolerans]
MSKMRAVESRYPTNALKNIFAPAALDFGPQQIRIADQWAKVYAIQAFPPAVEAGWLTAAANLPGVTLSLHALPEDPLTIVQDLNRRMGQLAGQLAVSKGGPLQAQRLERQIQDAQMLLHQIDAEQQSVFRVGVFLVVTAPDSSTGERLARRLEASLAAQGMRARPLVFLQEEGLRAAGPWGLFDTSLQGRAPQTWPVSTIASAWPFGSGGINHGAGIVLGHELDQHAVGELVLLDRWNPPPETGINNKNVNLLSPPGGGKTFAAIVMLLREWALGAKIYILDPEKREYQHVCRGVGGDWLNAGGGLTRINPFQPPAMKTMDEHVGLSPLAAHTQWLQTFLHLLMPGLTPMEQALLAGAVRETYEAASIPMAVDPTTIPNTEWPHIAHLYAVCQRHAETEGLSEWKTLVALLQEAAVGALAPLWAGPSTVRVDATADFVVADLMDLQTAPHAVKRAQYFNVLGYFWNLIRRDKSERKILVADEAWMLIDPQNPDTLRFLKEVAKVIRGYNGSLMVATQNVFDFLAPAVQADGEPVLTSAAINLLLRQDQKNLDYLIHLFHLSDAEQDKLLNAHRGEGLLIAGNQRTWIKVEGAPHEMAFMPPDRPDK